MNKLILTLLVTALNADNLNIKITNLSNQNGLVYIGLYNKSEDFLKMDKTYKKVSIRISSQTLKYRFKNLPKGSYAIALFHDKNQNKRFDRNILGIPKEGYGFSNNIRPTFRAAKFEEAKFKLDGNKHITINML
ncbi:MAG: DUF2141 domain-containing protein [Sulfurovum sp.]|nr:DUF2141 domain-containing protein [Sulfurovaceae bacterium]